MVMLVGCLILGAMLLLNRRGLSNNAKMGYLINFISLAPIILIAVLPFISGKADITNVTSGMLSGSLFKDANPVLLVFGLFGMAQWSACAWETAAMYGPQYMNPQKDTPRALISCGLICLVVFALVQFSCVSTLGTKVIDISTRPAMLMLAETDLGRYGGALAAAVMIIAMLSIIKTGFVGASHAMYSMSAAGNLPAPLGKLNEFGVPQNAMTATVILNIFLLLLNSSSAIVAASSVGYCFANGICLFSYVKYKRAKNKMEKRTGFCMPKFWYVLALVFAVLDVFVFSTGLLYLNWLDYGWIDLVLCVVILGAYFPLRNYAKHKWNISEAEAEEAA
jgi:amino acid transporter